MAHEKVAPWSPFPIVAKNPVLWVLRVEERTLDEGPLVLHMDTIVRDEADDARIVAAWRLIFLDVLAYRKRPVHYEGNLPLTAPDRRAFFWKLRNSPYLVECGTEYGLLPGTSSRTIEGFHFHAKAVVPPGFKLEHYVVRTGFDYAYEVVAFKCTTDPLSQSYLEDLGVPI